jgi:hypothetical protein
MRRAGLASLLLLQAVVAFVSFVLLVMTSSFAKRIEERIGDSRLAGLAGMVTSWIRHNGLVLCAAFFLVLNVAPTVLAFRMPERWLAVAKTAAWLEFVLAIFCFAIAVYATFEMFL